MDERKIQESVVEKVDVGEFPTGLKILIVDDDRTCLRVLERMLLKLFYQVTTCKLARDAISLLRKEKNKFDIVLCDLHMPDMDGFKLLDMINLEMDLPVVIMSSDDGNGVVMDGIIHGACDYLVKPIRMESIRLIWQHVVRKRKWSLTEFKEDENINVTDHKLLLVGQAHDTADQIMAVSDKESLQNLKRKREQEVHEEDDVDQGDSSGEVANTKKQRMIWTPELHDVFVAAVNQLGRDKAVPKKILERMQAMNVTGLSRANIASHLQKYRMHLQKGNQHPYDITDINASYHGRNLQFQTTGTSNQLTPQNFINPQSYEFKRSTDQSLYANSVASYDQGSNTFYSNTISESSHPLTVAFMPHDVSRTNLLYQNDCSSAGVTISDEDYPYTYVGNIVNDDLIYDYDPSFFGY